MAKRIKAKRIKANKAQRERRVFRVIVGVGYPRRSSDQQVA